MNGNGSKSIGLTLGLLSLAALLGATAGGIAGYEKAQDAQAVMASSIAEQLDKLREDAARIRSQTQIDQQRRADEDREARIHLEDQLRAELDRRSAATFDTRQVLIERIDQHLDRVNQRLDLLENRIYRGNGPR